jgi:site-specific DNA-methyltransferase (adenine-specific)
LKTAKAIAALAKSWPEAHEQMQDKPGTWSIRSGRSLRPDQPNIEQLLCEGGVIAERERGKFDPSPIKTIAANCIAQDVGAYHVGACRIDRSNGPHASRSSVGTGSGMSSENCYGDGLGGGVVAAEHPDGGYPKTVLLSPGGDRCPAKSLDAQSHGQRAMTRAGHGATGQPIDSHVYRDDRTSGGQCTNYADSGGASRFYTNLPIDDPALDPFMYTPKARKRDAGLRSDIANTHNTLKTVALMRWLMRLVCPVGGVVLSTFGGSGTDAVAAIAEGMRIVIMERRRDYYELMCSRVSAAIGSPEAAAEANEHAPVGGQLGLL